jgi:hypothetical protein
MPVKKRIAKKRIEIPAVAWEMLFASGWDFMGALDDLFLPDVLSYPHGSAARADAQEAWDHAAKGAWSVLGASYMATWKPSARTPLPWAAIKFGLPEGFTGGNASNV